MRKPVLNWTTTAALVWFIAAAAGHLRGDAIQPYPGGGNFFSGITVGADTTNGGSFGGNGGSGSLFAESKDPNGLGDAKAQAEFMSLDLYATASGGTAADAGASSTLFLQTGNAGVWVSDTLFANGHGMTAVGPYSSVSGTAKLQIYTASVGDPNYTGPVGNASCSLTLNGGDQSCSPGLIYIPDLSVFAIALSGSVGGSSDGYPGDSITADYWGTLQPGALQIYDQNMNPIGTYDLAPPAAAPEPASLALLGTGLAGLAEIVRRRRGAKPGEGTERQ